MAGGSVLIVMNYITSCCKPAIDLHATAGYSVSFFETDLLLGSFQ